MNRRVGYFLAVWLSATVSAFAAVADRPSVTPQDVFDSMRATFRADKAAGVHARYQFEISGPQGGVWSIEVKDERCRIEKTKSANPDVVIAASDKDWVALSNDQLSAPWAYLTGRLKMRGNHALARKLDQMFP